jgi:hypothetical protein
MEAVKLLGRLCVLAAYSARLVNILAKPSQIFFTPPLQGEVRLWLMRLPQPSLAINEGSVAQLLDAEESRRWRRFAFYEDAQRFLAGRAFLRTALGAVLGIPPRELAFSTGAFGKPTLAATGSDTLRFSLSRTSHAIALALAWGLTWESISTTWDVAPMWLDKLKFSVMRGNSKLWRPCLWPRESTG